MPIPRNWVEELAMEWLTIEGYLTESNVRLEAAGAGGVGEADIIGARLRDNCLEIMHIETGQLGRSFTENLKGARQKFGDTRRKGIETIIKEKIAWAGDVNYESIYIASYASRTQELKDELQKNGIEFLLLEKFIEERVFRAIGEWKKRQEEKGWRKTKGAMLPECYWLLNLLDFLHRKGILKRESERI